MSEIKQLVDRLKDFREERAWGQFFDPKNAAASISVEANELLELFLWQDKEGIEAKIKNNSEFKQKIAYELADVFSNCIQMAITLDLDVEKIILDKLEETKAKYPVDKFKGSPLKYNEL